jgi:hypothetical protein
VHGVGCEGAQPWQVGNGGSGGGCALLAPVSAPALPRPTALACVLHAHFMTARCVSNSMCGGDGRATCMHWPRASVSVTVLPCLPRRPARSPVCGWLCSCLQADFMAPPSFQYILRVRNTNIDGKRKVRCCGRPPFACWSRVFARIASWCGGAVTCGDVMRRGRGCCCR